MISIHRDRIDDIIARIDLLAARFGPMPGLNIVGSKLCWAQQIVSSLRRTSYTDVLLARKVDPIRCDPHSELFDPIRAAIHFGRSGLLDEAVWLVFVLTHFGKHSLDEWKLAKNIYGSFGDGQIWSFAAYGADQQGFERMLHRNSGKLADSKLAGRYSNHRKFESKKPNAISDTFLTFYAWQTEFGSFRDRVIKAHMVSGQEPQAAFDELYTSMKSVSRFGGGRLGRFDFLTMLGKLHLAPISPGSVYLDGASGPLDGARLLFFGDRKHPISGKALGRRVDDLDEVLEVGKQVIEDSLCNWQKSPGTFVYFRG